MKRLIPSCGFYLQICRSLITIGGQTLRLHLITGAASRRSGYTEGSNKSSYCQAAIRVNKNQTFVLKGLREALCKPTASKSCCALLLQSAPPRHAHERSPHTHLRLHAVGVKNKKEAGNSLAPRAASRVSASHFAVVFPPPVRLQRQM